MPTEVTLNFSDVANSSGKIKVENLNVIRSIFSDFDNQTVTASQFKQLQQIATNAGDNQVLEMCDISNGKNKLKSEITKGNVIFDKNWFSSKGTIYLNIPKGTPMFEIKKMYNLPDGALSDYCRDAGCNGGDKDRFTTIANQVWFSSEAFAKGNNMSIEEVRDLFNQSK